MSLTARVSFSSHEEFQLLRPEGTYSAVISGRLRFDAEDSGDWPVVGDFVQVTPNDDGPWVIHSVVPRKNALYRGLAERGEPDQLMAANVDVALIVTGLDHDFSLRRIERYIYLAKASRIRPIAVMNKVDLNPAALPSLGCEVYSVSALTGAGVDELARAIQPGESAVLLGSSGAGKSTLLNRLMAHELQRTSSVRESDSKGRHTTTSHQLVEMPQGWLLIDMPGIREVGLPTTSRESTDSAFPDIQALAAECHFPDCRHDGEPHCRVTEAVKTGELDAKRFENFRKMEREVGYQLRRSDKQAALALKNKWKAIHKEMKKFYKRPKHL